MKTAGYPSSHGHDLFEASNFLVAGHFQAGKEGHAKWTLLSCQDLPVGGARAGKRTPFEMRFGVNGGCGSRTLCGSSLGARKGS